MTDIPDIFTAILEFPKYKINAHGEVRRVKDNFRIKHIYDTKGYARISLSDGNGKQWVRKIHHLVLHTFICPRPKGKLACHKDDDKRNNHVSNLYWGTSRENADDQTRNGKRARGKTHGKYKGPK